MRIDRWIKINIGKLPQSLIEKDLRKGKIKLNNKKVKSYIKLKLKDEIKLYNINYKLDKSKKVTDYIPNNKIIKENENKIIENNENYIVINKNAGIPVQGGTKSRNNLVNVFSKSKIFYNSKPYTVHRLDKDTSGILLIAKNRETAKLFTSMFRLRKIHKIYLAIVHNEFEKNSGELTHDLIRYEGKKKIIERAYTHFKVIDKNSNATLLELKPITGRKHQLRKQLNIIGHSIVGDDKYYQFNNKNKNKNLLLHAYKIKFMIKSSKYNFTAQLPEYFKNYIKIKKLNF